MTTTRRITETVLKERLKQQKSAAFFPHLLLIFATCTGAFLFGGVLGWGVAALEHLKELEIKQTARSNFQWIVTIGPLSIPFGLIFWAFVTRRLGPKKTILLQTPFQLLGWFFMSTSNSYNVYCTNRFITGFCVTCYSYAGEELLIHCAQRKFMKICFTLFNCSMALGIVFMNSVSALLSRGWVCLICASVAIISLMLLLLIFETPLFLIKKSELSAEDALKFYTGKQNVEPEVNILRQQIVFTQLTSYRHMLSSKVVLRAFLIIILLNILKMMCGYFPLLIDSADILTKTSSFISPYGDNNIIFGSVLVLSKFIGYTVLLRRKYLTVKKPMIVSLSLLSIVLLALGIVLYAQTLNYQVKGLVVILLCLHVSAYEVGINICPNFLLYDYMPYQIYKFSSEVMKLLRWILVYVSVEMFMLLQREFDMAITFLVSSGLCFVGVFYVAYFVVESRGKSLIGIQIELGGNPIGNRGSHRQRAANPYETYEDIHYLRDLVSESLNLPKPENV